MAELNILEAIRGAMDEELERDPSVMVLGEDVGKKGGVFGATEGLWPSTATSACSTRRSPRR